MNDSYDFAVIGGDLRQVYLVGELSFCGKSVCHYALCAPAGGCRPIHSSNTVSSDYTAASADYMAAPDDYMTVSAVSEVSLTDACCNSACIVGPVPLSRNGLDLNQSGEEDTVSLSQILACLHSGQFFFAGCIPGNFRAEAVNRGVYVYDLMEDPSLASFNSIATAEGAICEAISTSPLNLRHSCCSVLGFGNCGRTISHYLKGMLCHLQVITDDPKELAQAALIADQTAKICEFPALAGESDFIFNTIPAVLITADLLRQLKPSVTIIDIASPPGGVDFSAAQELNIHAVQCPGLPGRYAPASSARGILETIRQILYQSFS